MSIGHYGSLDEFGEDDWRLYQPKHTEQGFGEKEEEEAPDLLEIQRGRIRALIDTMEY